MQSNLKIYLYVLALTGVTALILSSMYNFLEPIQSKNKEDAKKKSIISSLPDSIKGQAVNKADMNFDKNVKIVLLDANGKVVFEQKENTSKEEVDKQMSELNKRGQGVKYTKLIDLDLALEEKFAADKRVYPVYVVEYQGSNILIVSVRGNGLWDKIWGFVCLDKQEDKWAIAGVNFEHKAETPGLGAEIKDSKSFKDEFKGKQLYNDKGDYVSVSVVKAIKNKNYEVKSISGATVTSVGVSDMMIRGISYYLPYLESITSNAGGK